MFAAGVFDPNIAIDMFLGMITGAGVFFIITLIGGLIAGKEAMGFGDVKLMAGLGSVFGLVNTIMISVTSFLLGSIISIILLIARRKKGNEYIPFGPFIILATFVIMFVPEDLMMYALLEVFTLGMYK